MASLIFYALGTVIIYLVWNLQSLARNYIKARRSGFPILVSPVNTGNLIWMIGAIPLRPFFARILPPKQFDRINASTYGWEHYARWGIFERLGPAFILVNPGKNELMVADPEIVHSILVRKADFEQSHIASLIIGMFGPNLISSVGDDWVRLRKIVAPLLNERISKSVWQEGAKQARQMLDSLGISKLDNGSDMISTLETDATIPALRTVAINVLLAVAYGAESSWQDKTSQAPAGYHLSYIDSILAVCENLVPCTFISPKLLTSTIMPSMVRRIGYAVQEFPRHVAAILDAEKKSGGPAKNNLLSTLARASDPDAPDDGKSKPQLSELELTGNMFQFSTAGFDTTSNTFSYAVQLLAVHPEWQEWIGAEIDGEAPAGIENPYEKTFPKLKRVLALMYETLRLFNSLAHITRETLSTQEIVTGSKTYTVPPETTIYINTGCVQVNPAIWGSDALEFRPDRWIEKDGSMFRPQRATFFPWGLGPRVCPGQKMAEVEFVSVMTTIFGSYRVTPVVKAGETLEDARQRLKDIMQDSQPRVTLQVNRPRDVLLRWEKR